LAETTLSPNSAVADPVDEWAPNGAATRLEAILVAGDSKFVFDGGSGATLEVGFEDVPVEASSITSAQVYVYASGAGENYLNVELFVGGASKGIDTALVDHGDYYTFSKSSWDGPWTSDEANAITVVFEVDAAGKASGVVVDSVAMPIEYSEGVPPNHRDKLAGGFAALDGGMRS
jgi:hypothetical protein